MEKSVSLFNLCNLENVLQRNLRTGTAKEWIFRASGGTRFKNFCQPWCRKGGGGTPRCNQSAQKDSRYVTVRTARNEETSKDRDTRDIYQIHTRVYSVHRHALTDELLARVNPFYEDDQISQMYARKRDIVTVKNSDHSKECHQKRLILCNIREAYLEYKSTFSDDKIEFSKFAEL